MAILMVLLAFLAGGDPLRAASGPRGERATAELNQAYAALRAGDKAGARTKLEQVVAIDPEDYTAQLQLGYVDYDLKDWKGAQAAFSAAARSPDEDQRRKARSALRVVRAAARRAYFDVYASPLYMTRFGDAVGFLEGQYHLKPAPESPVSFYAGTRYVQDSRSRGGSLPQIYSDNVWELGSGIRIQPPGWKVSLSAEESLAFNLVRTPSHPHNTEGDFRAVLAGYQDFELGRPFVDVGASGGYYGRFDNAIAYAQFREGLELWSGKRQRLLGYLRQNLSGDKNADFFNNVAEFGPGLEFWPWRSENLKLRGEYVHGVYYGREKSGEPNPYGPRFDDFRVTLLFGGRF